MRIGLLHPGEMGAALGGVLVRGGHEVVWTPAERSPDTVERARRQGLESVDSVAVMAAQCPAILSICPPHAAEAVADAVGPGYRGVFADLNAVAPQTVQRIGARMRRVVDGAIVGSPPDGRIGPRVYLSGREAGALAETLRSAGMAVTVVSDRLGAASAVKMTYAAWTKGTAALLLAIRATARAYEVEEVLDDAWAESGSALRAQSERAALAAVTKGWRWAGEMREVADAFQQAGLPGEFHRGAATVFESIPRAADIVQDPATLLTQVIDTLLKP